MKSRSDFILRAISIDMFYVYLLESFIDKSWYIGFSADLRNRFKSHNKKENLATKNKTPWKLVYYEAYIDKLDATKREEFLKSGSGRKFLKKQLRNYFKSSYN